MQGRRDVGTSTDPPGDPSEGIQARHALRWLCDPTVLRLGRELRALGLAASACAPERVPRDPHAVLLTRSRRLLADTDLRALPATLLLRTDSLVGQLSTLQSLFGITRIARPWTLCVRCGGALRRYPPRHFRDEAWPYVVATVKWIAQCQSCRHLFWRATHTARQESLWWKAFGSVPNGPGEDEAL